METISQNCRVGKAGKKIKQDLWSYFTPSNKQHQYILSLCIQYGWHKKHPKTGNEVADLTALDKWLRGKHKSGQAPVKKPLKSMSTKELSKIIVALENMVVKQDF